MRYPPFLPDGGSIGFVAPSFGAFIEPYHSLFDRALENFRKLGYQTVTGPNVYKGDGIGISTDPESCGRELTDMYLRKDSHILLSAGGGELMCGVLDHIDLEALKKAAPKWYLGYSDNTNFTYLSAVLLDTASLYCPCASSFGMEPWHEALWDAWNIITGKSLSVRSYDLWEKAEDPEDTNIYAPYHVTEPVEIRPFFYDGRPVSGRFLGGCLDILQILAGTCYDATAAFCERYREDGIIFFLEACDLNVFGIRRALWQLRHAGWFRHVKAFLIGRPLCFGQELMGLDRCGAVLEILKDYGVPIFMDTDIGHLPPMMPIISGGFGTLRFENGKLTVDYELK